MGKEFTPEFEDFKNFESLGYLEKIELCFVKNNLDTFNIGINENQVYAISGVKYLDLYKVPDGKKYHSLHPKNEEEENKIIRIFEENDFFIGRNYGSFDSKVDEVLTFDFLKENWLTRFEKAPLKDEFLSEEVESIKYRIDHSNGIVNHFKAFYDLGVRKGKNGGMINHYFWQLYFEYYATKSIFSSFHTLISCLRAYYNGNFMFEYYAFLRNGGKNTIPKIVDSQSNPKASMILRKTDDLAVYRYFLGEIGIKKRINLDISNDSKIEYQKEMKEFKSAYEGCEFKLNSVYKNSVTINNELSNFIKSQTTIKASYCDILERVKRQIIIQYPNLSEKIVGCFKKYNIH